MGAVADWKEVPMAIVGGLDVHRRQITFDYVDTGSGELHRGRIVPADRMTLRTWLGSFAGQDARFVVEGCTGWRYVVEELELAGMEAHLAEPADTAAARGRKRRAKTDRSDAGHLRELLASGTVPESWIPPVEVREVRTRVRLYKDLDDARGVWLQRIHATLFHHGVPVPNGSVLSPQARPGLEAGAGLSVAGREAVAVALRMIDMIEAERVRLRTELAGFARRQAGCRALAGEYGFGPLTSVAVWAELGDPQRFSASRQAVRHTGLDVTVYASDGKRSRGHLARQGPPVLRWALFETAQSAARRASPDHAYYTAVKDRCGANRAALSVARRQVRRAHHILRSLGDAAFAPAEPATR
jgi:transposase